VSSLSHSRFVSLFCSLSRVLFFALDSVHSHTVPLFGTTALSVVLQNLVGLKESPDSTNSQSSTCPEGVLVDSTADDLRLVRSMRASKQMWGEAGENGQLVLREDRRFILGCCPQCSRYCGAHFGSLQTGSPAGHLNLAICSSLSCSLSLTCFL
jgi:hypothetical protein